MMPDLRDRHNLVLSTRSPSAVEQYIQALDLQLSLNAGGVDGLTKAVETDPDFAVGQAGLAFAQWYRQDVPAAKVTVQQARALAPSTTQREQRHVEIVGAVIDGQSARAMSLIREHLAEFPRDALIVHLGTMMIAGSGLLSRRQDNFDLLAQVAPAFGDDWWFQGAFANCPVGSS
jgi:hypothetical protein